MGPFEAIIPVTAIALLFLGLPWLILHYVTKWKQSSSLTVEDENLLDELHELARRLDERMTTIERIIAADRDQIASRPADPRLADMRSAGFNPRLVEPQPTVKDR